MSSIIIAIALAATAPSMKEADIRRLMELTGMGALGSQVTTQVMNSFKTAFPKVPEADWTELERAQNPSELVTLIVPVYDRHFSHEEIKQLIGFYETPLGQKLLKELPGVTQESLTLSENWGRKMGQRVMNRLEAKGYKLPLEK